MNPKLINWSLFFILSIIWGSSFILMKEGLKELSAYEVATIRILSAGIILLPFALKGFREIHFKDMGKVLVSGLLGSFFPAVLFCIAETQIDSALAGMLNALTPLFVIIIGFLFFKSSVQLNKTVGVVIGFCGMLLLFFSKDGNTTNSNMIFSSLVIAATICYGINVNLVSKYLKHIGSLNLAAVSFGFLIVPSAILLYFLGFFNHSFFNRALLISSSASIVLGVFGTAIASILFYMLMKRAGALFSSMVTYGIPFVAVFWGLLAGETVSGLQILGLMIILTGVYLANR
jgi:drug/metabolite transporter (DMT)-like permease